MFYTKRANQMKQAPLCKSRNDRMKISIEGSVKNIKNFQQKYDDF